LPPPPWRYQLLHPRRASGRRPSHPYA
jgi:hypothetical protein